MPPFPALACLPRRYELPWEDKSFEYPPNLAPPKQILIDASNGASDYGNKFGEPLVAGYTRTFGQRLPGGDRREWIKPIMFRQAAYAICWLFGALHKQGQGGTRHGMDLPRVRSAFFCMHALIPLLNCLSLPLQRRPGPD